MTADLGTSERDLEAAAAMLRRGGLVAFPTETVYGLGAVATNDRAVARIFEAKARPHFNPLIVHVLDVAAARPLAQWTPLGEALAEAFWPGPLSLILGRREGTMLSPLVSAGGPTVALRAPGNPIARALLQKTVLPVAAPSANPAGGISPTRAEHVVDGLGGRIDAVIDGGPTTVGIESTVVDATGVQPVLLRPGGITREAIEQVTGPVASPSGERGPGAALRSPGQLVSHYAPDHPLRLDASEVAGDEALLAFGDRCPSGAAITRNLSPSGDVMEAAANLFTFLHDLDRAKVRAIAVVPIPARGLGDAINERLARAAAPRTDAGGGGRSATG